MRRQIQVPLAGAVAGAVLLLGGCTRKGPDYVPPATPQVSATDPWTTELDGGEQAVPADDEMLSHWWSTLNDPLLTSIEERAVLGNLDIRQAEARIRQVRAQRNIERSGLLPTVEVGASAGVSRSSDSGGFNRVSDNYSAGFDASWEPDIFGGTARSIEAAEADLQASEEDLRDVLVSLTAEVALNYVDVRSYQARLSFAIANRDSQESSYNLANSRFEAGLGTNLDVQQARSNLESTRASIPALEEGITQAMNRLAVLLGEKPGALEAELDAPAPIPVTPTDVAVGVPADLLRRRPDIRSAERAVAAQTARVGVATADLYPRFSLSGSLGLDSVSVLDLLSIGGIATTVAGSVQHTVFDRNRLREYINVEDAALDLTLAQYESTVLGAIEDVENALQSYAKEQVRRQSLTEAASASATAAELSTELYASGLRDFLEVLDAQRSLLSFQDQLAQSDGLVTSNLIRLYKALGGGWNSLEAQRVSAAVNPAGAK